LPVSAPLLSYLRSYERFPFRLASNTRKHRQFKRQGFMLCARLPRYTESEGKDRNMRV